MPLLYSDVEKEVRRLLTKTTMEDMLLYLKQANPSFWGLKQPQYFQRRMFVLAMHHAITGMGYHQILRKVKQLGFKITSKSLKHNTQQIRRTLAEWGKSKVVLGKKPDWERAMKNVAGKKKFPKLQFWIDSTDFAMQNKGGKRKKDPNWSFKCNSKGRRYMVLMDGVGRIRKMWGGYSPKVFDGHWLEMFRRFFEKKLKGSGVIADQHFEWGKNLKDLAWYTAHHEPRFGRNNNAATQQEEADTDDEGVDLQVLTKDQRSFNSALYKLRARVELPFGENKSIFQLLSTHWRESERQLDHMVWIAAGVYNSKK